MWSHVEIEASLGRSRATITSVLVRIHRVGGHVDFQVGRHSGETEEYPRILKPPNPNLTTMLINSWERQRGSHIGLVTNTVRLHTESLCKPEWPVINFLGVACGPPGLFLFGFSLYFFCESISFIKDHFPFGLWLLKTRPLFVNNINILTDYLGIP